MPWEKRKTHPCGLKGRESLARLTTLVGVKTPAAFQAALLCHSSPPRASAFGLSPGLDLPARWAGCFFTENHPSVDPTFSDIQRQATRLSKG